MMKKDHRPTWCEINLDNLIHNLKEIKRVVGDKEILAVVKADAYGHGAVECAKTLVANGVQRLAVAFVDEGIQLRKAGINCSILILGYTPHNHIDQLLKWNLIPTVYTVDFAQRISDYVKSDFKIHIKLDTGMGRLGFRGEKVSVQSIVEISNMKNIEIEGIYSHFSVADEKDKKYSNMQLQIFKDIISKVEDEGINIPYKHIANSAAIIDLPESYFNMVRPGLILYGLYPSNEVKKHLIDLKPLKSLKTTIGYIKKVEKGSSISYGRKYIADDIKTVATLPVGYADGFSRLLTNNCEVIVKGKRVPVIGTVCMDQISIDVSDVENIDIGDEVILYGEGMPIDEIAKKIGTINYEITCMTKARVPKLYFLNKNLYKMDNFLVD